jgi:hypothetical protein
MAHATPQSCDHQGLRDCEGTIGGNGKSNEEYQHCYRRTRAHTLHGGIGHFQRCAILAVAALLAPAFARAQICDRVQFVHRTPRTSEQQCGVDSLYVCLLAAGITSMDLKALEKDLSPGPKGVTVEGLLTECDKRGVMAIAARMNPKRIPDYGNPMILHVNGSHFIALLETQGDDLLVFDNAYGLLRIPRDLWSSIYSWDGTGVIVGFPTPFECVGLYGRLLIATCGGFLILVFLYRCLIGYRRRRQICVWRHVLE